MITLLLAAHTVQKSLKHQTGIDFHDALQVGQDAPEPLRTAISIQGDKSDRGHHPA
jgi:hypothetical protein